MLETDDKDILNLQNKNGRSVADMLGKNNNKEENENKTNVNQNNKSIYE